MCSCNEELAQAVTFALMDQSASELRELLIQLLPLYLCLLYTHTQYKSIYAKTKNQMNTEQSNIIYKI